MYDILDKHESGESSGGGWVSWGRYLFYIILFCPQINPIHN